jgi:hypothetical protein
MPVEYKSPVPAQSRREEDDQCEEPEEDRHERREEIAGVEHRKSKHRSEYEEKKNRAFHRGKQIDFALNCEMMRAP